MNTIKNIYNDNEIKEYKMKKKRKIYLSLYNILRC